MFKKTLVFLTTVVLLVGLMVMPASAASSAATVYDYMDISECFWQESGYDYIWITAPKTSQGIAIRNKDKIFVRSEKTTGNPTVTFNAESDGSQNYSLIFAMSYLWTHNFPAGTTVSLRPKFKVTGIDWETGLKQRGESHFFCNYFDADPFELLEFKSYDSEFDLYVEPSTNFVDGTITNYGFAVQVGSWYKGFIPKQDCQITVELTDLAIEMRVPTWHRQQWIEGNATTLAEKNNLLLNQQQELLEDLNAEQQITNDKLDQMPGEIGDEMESIIDKENQDASNAGDSAANELLDIIPNESEGFIDAIGSLVGSMSYNGTNAVLPVPSITLPEIPGVMSAVKLTDKQEVDFGFWIQKLPSDILQLVRILCTIALIVYCFKELYSTISYALTLKGGKSDE